MLLTDLDIGKEAIITAIEAEEELKNRLYSFGIIPNEKIKVMSHSIGKSTIEIDVDGTLIALRKDEADKIEVSEVK